MSDTNPNLEEVIFEVALQIAGEEERAIFLDQACLDKPDLRRRLEALLGAQNRGTGFLPSSKKDVSNTPTLFEDPTPRGEHRVIGRYKLLQRLGEGGFGEVWMAEQKKPVKRRVALKIIKLGMDTKEVIGRFEAERQALALMDHPNIARVFDAGCTDTGRPYFIMELVRGVKITEYCNKQKLSTRERLELFIKVCHAVQHAHQKGIIHRDLKPSNILITLHDGVPVPKVIDFGISKAMQGELTDHTVFTRFEQFIGTPAYISPEQAEMSGLDVDTRSDIYSLGVLLYELLVGRTPFDAVEMTRGGLEALRLIIREKDPVRPSTKLRTLSQEDLTSTAQRHRSVGNQLENSLRGDLDWIVMKCLEKDRVRRYETANALALDINRYLTNEPVVARPPNPAYRIRKAWQRNKILYTAGAAVVSALVIGFGVSSWQAMRATQAREAGEVQRLLAEEKQKDAEEQKRLALAAKNEADTQRQQADAQREYSEKLLYASNMTLVQEAFEDHNYMDVERLLEETADYPDRGIEWYYWQRQMHPENSVFLGHKDMITSLAFSPDSTMLASMDDKGILILWDHKTGAEIYRNDALIFGSNIKFSPDGKWILLDKRYSWHRHPELAFILDAETGKVIHQNKKNYTYGAFSPDSKRFVATSGANLEICDTLTGEVLRTITDIRDGFYGIQFVCFDAKGQDVLAVLRIQRRPNDAFAVYRWNAQTGALIAPPITGAGLEGTWWESIATNRDATRLILGTFLGGNLFMNIHREKTHPSWPVNERDSKFPGQTGFVNCFAFSDDGRYMISGSADSTVKIWDTSTLEEINQIHGHNNLCDIDWSPDDRWIATGDESGVIRIFDKKGIWEGTISPSRRNESHLTPPEYFFPKVDKKDIKMVKFEMSSNNRHLIQLLSVNQEDIILVQDLLSKSRPHELRDPFNRIIRNARFTPDGSQVITPVNAEKNHPGGVVIWDAQTGKIVRETTPIQSNVEDADMTPDGKYLILLAGNYYFLPDIHRLEDGGVWIVDTGSWQPILQLRIPVSERAKTAISPDSKHVAIPLNSSVVKIINIETGESLATLKGHKGNVFSVTYSSDGRRILTGSSDQTSKLWDASTGRELLTLTGHDFQIEYLEFLDSGAGIITGSNLGVSYRNDYFWEAAHPEQVDAWRRQAKEHEIQKEAFSKMLTEKAIRGTSSFQNPYIKEEILRK